ncbi:MAG TPA: hypothetical protein VIJ22_17615 [Polyangiaceae bacterium]
MRLHTLGLSVLVVLVPALAGLYACGSNGNHDTGSGDGSLGSETPIFGSDGGMTYDAPLPFIDGGFTAPDCPGCTFPGPGAPACPSGTPPINIAYPYDGVLVPPNMNVISVMWTPFGAAFQEFEVDFTNSVTDMHVITKCATQTMDTEQPAPVASGGCELALSQAMWSFVANQNRGGSPVTITVRGTTDGTCASSSTGTVRLSFAQDDMLGVIYYWKSTISSNGVGGQVWEKSFGDSNPETDVTSAFGSTCNGCHALSRDGLRLFIDSDDDDSDDEYGDVASSLVDMVAKMPIGGGGGRGNMPAGFASFYPDHSKFLLSNGDGPSRPPPNEMHLYDGNTDMAQPDITVGTSAQAPTMEDWGPDGKSVVFVVPTANGSWDGNSRTDDDHIFGGSLYTMTYSGGTFGAATPFLMSAGENNYYPSYSPDGQLIIFDRAPLVGTAATLTACSGCFCPNDSFSNPSARVMLTKAAMGGAAIDLEAANGSPSATPLNFSNSWPKWSPFLQNYQGDKLLWIAFSSTRDYGLRVRNHVAGAGQYQCYPADSYEQPGTAHHSAFAPQCQQPQIWMAAVDVSTAVADVAKDPSRPGFWLPFQDITTHNHTPQWTQNTAPPPDAGACVNTGGSCTQGGTCCTGLVCQADGLCAQLAQ